MKNKAILLAIAFLLLIVSCSSDSFSLSSVSLRRNIDMTGEVKKEEAVLSFDINGVDVDSAYTFLLVSPSGDLRWEGKVDTSGGKSSVDTLSITPGASFESGTYTLYVYSSGGGEVDTTLDIAREEGNYTYENISKKNDAVIKYYDSMSFETDESKATWAVAEYTDRYSNRIKIIVDIEK